MNNCIFCHRPLHGSVSVDVLIQWLDFGIHESETVKEFAHHDCLDAAKRWFDERERQSTWSVSRGAS